MINSSAINYINFFNQPSSCISTFEGLNWTKKATSLIKSYGSLFAYSLTKLPCVLFNAEKQLDNYINPQKYSKKKLVVCLHGLNSSPAQFEKIIRQIKTYSLKETDIFIPRILKKGNASLSEVVKPIFDQIKYWTQTGRDKELVLIGISNGGRIARAIESEVSKPGNNENLKKIKFISIVGACSGSSMADLALKLKLSCLMSPNISNEMPTQSACNHRLKKEWEEGLKNTTHLKREYTFIASPHDWMVPNYTSTLLDIPNIEARYAIVCGHGHNSIVNAVSKTVSEIACSE